MCISLHLVANKVNGCIPMENNYWSLKTDQGTITSSLALRLLSKAPRLPTLAICGCARHAALAVTDKMCE